ncbi:MAG TPA: lipoyl(octanoyl) transferase LipB [Gammaproteobacteria bacterium]|nr:lipoyl(octanoyl) transferase LipB [Gammaproteobacteria bacterium]
MPDSVLPDNVLRVRRFGLREYRPVWEAMRGFTDARNEATPDELWLVEHPPVFTLGYNGKTQHLIAPSAIPVIHTDRGGQVTYHGPGQIVAYVLCDLRRRGWGVRQLVTALEQAVIALLNEHGVNADTRRDAPGVYVAGAKIAALGLRVRRGCSYHGLSLNVAMDLAPFSRINPCGYPDMPVTDLRKLGVITDMAELQQSVTTQFAQRLGYKITEVMQADEHLSACA